MPSALLAGAILAQQSGGIPRFYRRDEVTAMAKQRL
jgi:hypothetical protein